MISELCLQGKVLLVWRFELFLQDLFFHRRQLIREFWCCSSPFFEIYRKILGFLMESSVGRALLACLRDFFVSLFHEPPVFKSKMFVSASSRGGKKREDRSMVAANHWEVIGRRVRISCAPIRISQGTIKTFESWHGIASPVRPSVGRTAVSQIDRTTLCDMITKSINTSKIRSTRT